MGCCGGGGSQRFGTLDDVGQQRRCAASGFTDRRDTRRFRRKLARQLSRPVSGDPGCARPAPRGRRGGHRQHLQHRCHPAISEPCRVRLIQVGAEGPHPGCRGRTRTVGYPGQRCVPRARRDTHARCRDAGAACGNAPCSAGSASRRRSPTRWRSWCPSTHRSSPVRNSSSTADKPCRSDDTRWQRLFRWESSAPARAGWHWESSCGRPALATSPSSTARTASAEPGGSTPIRAWPATSSLTCTRTRST